MDYKKEWITLHSLGTGLASNALKGKKIKGNTLNRVLKSNKYVLTLLLERKMFRLRRLRPIAYKVQLGS